MKKIILVLIILSVAIGNSQAFTGVNDNKLQIGTNLQNNGTGVNLSYDYGLGQNISIGVSSSYALGISDEVSKNTADRFDLKARFNANLGNVINIDENFDIYPGLNLSLKNFGGHLGMRYFFSEGFGIYTEFNTPFAKYKTDVLEPSEKLHNQFTFNLGAVFNM